MKSSLKLFFLAGIILITSYVYPLEGDDFSRYDVHDTHGHSDNDKELVKRSDHKEHKNDHNDHDKHNNHNHSDNDKKLNKHSDHKEQDHKNEKFGEGKGIIEVKDGGKKFRLSKEAMKTLKLETVRLDASSKGVYEVPSKSVVSYQEHNGVYRRQGLWFEMITVEIIKRGKHESQIKSNQLLQDDLVVSEGVGLLRIAHLEASGQGGKGHVH